MSDLPRVKYADLAWAAAFARIKTGQKLCARGIDYRVEWKHEDPDWVQLVYRHEKKLQRRVVRQGETILLELRPE